MAEAEPARRIAYQPALDGLRAVAVVLVMLYHQRDLVFDGMGRGGFLGVDIFFVLSGFLITALLVAEYDRTRAIAYVRFWVRRLRRLVPALLVMLVLALVLARFAFATEAQAAVRNDVPWVLAYVQNWHIALANGAFTSPLSHTWSLAIEEQWYLVWPLVLTVVLHFARTRRARVLSVAGLTLAAVGWSAYVLEHYGFSRAYFGTDARAAELLVGATLALLSTRGVFHTGPRIARAVRCTGAVSLLALVGLGLFVPDGSTWFSLGRFGIALLTAGVIVAAVAPRGVVRTVLAFTPVVLVGRISYGLYLFHFPIFQWLGPDRVSLSGAPLLLLRFAVTGVVAVASFVLVEKPIREGRVRDVVIVPVGVMVAAALLVATPRSLEPVPPAPRSALLAYVLGHAAAETPPGEVRVLVLGGNGASLLNLATQGTYDGEGIRGIALGTNGCGIAGTSRRCRAIPDDLEALVRTLKAQVVLVLVDDQDVLDAERAGNTRALRATLDRARHATAGRRLVLVEPPCTSGPDSTARAEVVRLVNEWSAVRAVRTVPSPAASCTATGRTEPSPTSLWSALADLATAR